MMVEAIAVSQGLRYCLQRGINKINLETDSLSLSRMIKFRGKLLI